MALKKKSLPRVARSYRIKARGCSSPLETGRYHLSVTSHYPKILGSGTLSISPRLDQGRAEPSISTCAPQHPRYINLEGSGRQVKPGSSQEDFKDWWARGKGAEIDVTQGRKLLSLFPGI